MHKRKQQQRIQLFSIFAAIMMVFSLFAPTLSAQSLSLGVEDNNNGLHESAVDSNKLAEQKISNRLMDEFKDNDSVTFLVKFDEKADTTKAAQEARKAAESANLSSHKAELSQRSAVISELKSVSINSQGHVKEFLENQVEDGNVEDFHSYYIVNGMTVTASKDVAEKLAKFSEVEKILPNEQRTLNNPFGQKVEVPKASLQDDDDIEWSVDRVNAPDAWALGIDGTGTVVASLDTGVQWDHPALKEQYRGYDSETGEVDHEFSFYDATSDGYEVPADDNGHGTHVTGTMVGHETDGSNQIGVAPGAKWIAARVFDAEGNATDADLLDAAEWIMAPGGRTDMAPDVVNNSWGGGPGLDEWYRDTVQAWRDAEIFPEFAAGNTDLFNPGGPGSVAAPANYPESFAVGATDSEDMIADFSLQGPSPYDEIKPEIAAPGVGIRSAVPGDGYDSMSGTSMASPAVSGIAALLRQVNADLSVDAMEETLLNTAVPLTDDEFTDVPNNAYGHGLIDASAAVSSILDGVGTIEGTVEDSNDSSPLGAKVSVLETGSSTNADSEDGHYTLMSSPGTFTVKAETYGYESDEQEVDVDADETTEANFKLEELAQSTVTGTITDEDTGEPIEGATLLLVEDANVDPVETDEDGHYSLTAYEDTYTLKVMAKNYHGTEVEVDLNNDVDLDIELEPFYTVPGGEIAYDDGVADNARAFYDAGNSWAVRMSLPEGKEKAVVTDGVFKFWNPEFPVPGGTDFAVEVWDASGDDGLPGEKLAGPIDAEAVRDETDWTVVDLSDHNIVVDGDFYMVYVQTAANTGAPGLATDETSPNAERSYQGVGGSWELSPADEGNYMIRARVAYEVETPVITSPADGQVTNDPDVTIEGTASPETTVELLSDGEEVDSVEVGDDGEFAFDRELDEGENEFIAVSKVDGSKTGESDPVVITLDTEAPELTVSNPVDGDKTNRETVTVEGNVQDEHLEYVEVNGQEADVDEDGAFSKRILLDNGENVIEVTAADEAGNTVTETVTLDVKYDAPEINNLTPTEDKDLEAGESVMIEFDSEPGARATFVVHMPLTNAGITQNPTELPMMEMQDGKYVGYWTATKNAYAEGAVIEVIVKDAYGNETREQADGKLFINVEE